MTQIIPWASGFPLGAATKIRCRDPGLAERTVGSLIEPRRLAVRGNPRATDIRISHLAIGHSQLFGVTHGAAVLATAAPIRSYQVMVPLRGKLTAQTRYGEIVAAPGSALVYSPLDRLETLWSDHCVGMVLSVPAERLRALAREACPGMDTGVMPLKPLMQLGEGGGRSFANALGTICLESLDPDSAFSRGLTRASVEETLLLSLLLAQRPDSEGLARLGHPNRQRHVAETVALIETHCAEDLAIDDLACAAKVSARTLQYGFMEQFGIGPMSYLKQVRLRRIHEALRSARPGTDTVGEIAARWGYYNGSAFAAAYRKMFGERPSETLARYR